MEFFAELSAVLFRPDTLSGTVRLAIPLLLAALGGVFSERAGVVNIALEGTMLNGAFAAITATHYTGNPWLGVLAGIAAGVATAALHAAVTVWAKADQIISGVGINLTAVGLTQFLCSVIFHSSSNSPMVATISPFWKADPEHPSALGTIFLSYSPIAYLALALVAVSHVVLYRTAFGLRLRAVGENPQAADTLGIHVPAMRWSGVLIGGALAGLGGVYLAVDSAQFVQNMTAGRGYIALAAMIFGKWTPVGALAACLLFGFAMKMQFSLMGAANAPSLKEIPSQFWEALPYVVTIVVLAGFVGKAVPPAAIGRPYEKTES